MKALRTALVLHIVIQGMERLSASDDKIRILSASKLYQQSLTFLKKEVESGNHDTFIIYRGKDALGRFHIPPLLQSANHVVVMGYNNGMLANVLQVLDGMMFKSRDATISVDWSPNPEHLDFGYGKQYSNLWTEIFFPLNGARIEEPIFAMPTRVNPLFIGPNRALYFRKKSLFSSHRLAYHEHAKRIQIQDPGIREEIASYEATFDDLRTKVGKIIGLHYRHLGSGVVRAQGVPPASIDEFITGLRQSLGENNTIFVATDDIDFVAAVKAYQLKWKANVLIRNVSRVSNKEDATHGDNAEVHRLEPTLQDATDVIVDTWLLSKCDVLIHNTDSNIVLVASILNPSLKLVHQVSRVQSRLRLSEL